MDIYIYIERERERDTRARTYIRVCMCERACGHIHKRRVVGRTGRRGGGEGSERETVKKKIV